MADGSTGKLWIIRSIVLLGVVALVGGVAWVYMRDRITPPPPKPLSLNEPAQPQASGPPDGQLPKGVAQRPTFSVLGDSYALGYGVDWPRGWVARVANEMCWTLLNNSAQGGTGFTSAGSEPGRLTYGQRVAAVTAGGPQIVLVQGGLNDGGATSRQITDAAAETFKAIKARVGAGIVVGIGPVAVPGKDWREVAGVSGAIAAAASAIGISYVDPVAEKWLSTARSYDVDRIHPNVFGYDEFARRLADALKRGGLQPSCD